MKQINALNLMELESRVAPRAYAGIEAMAEQAVEASGDAPEPTPQDDLQAWLDRFVFSRLERQFAEDQGSTDAGLTTGESK